MDKKLFFGDMRIPELIRSFVSLVNEPYYNEGWSHGHGWSPDRMARLSNVDAVCLHPQQAVLGMG